MAQIVNSEIVRKLLNTMINISRRKTTESHAFIVMDSLIKKLEERYDFLRHVELRDTRFLEDDNSITVMSDLDSVPPSEIGKAIYAIITTMNTSLGKDAGHFFIREISGSIGEEYHSTMRDMGVDLSLMQLEYEVNELERRLTSTRKTD